MRSDRLTVVHGFTLVELLISMGIFSVLLAVLYPAFSSVSKNTGEIGDKEEMMQKGQRVLDYMAEELRMAGLFVGGHPNPLMDDFGNKGIIFCGVPLYDSLEHLDRNDPADNYSDEITFLTSERVPTTLANAPYLQATADVEAGGDLIPVNASNGDASDIVPDTGTSNNAQAFITFDNLKPSLGKLLYQVTGYNGANLTIASPGIDKMQTVTKFSNVYLIERKRFSVDANRNLVITKWKSDCTQAPDNILLASFGTGTKNGGVDGFQVEFNLAARPTGIVGDRVGLVSSITGTDVEYVKTVTMWLLVRSDFPANGYTDTQSYTLGSANPVVIPAFNDQYRRMVLTKSVEVKNVGL